MVEQVSLRWVRTIDLEEPDDGRPPCINHTALLVRGPKDDPLVELLIHEYPGYMEEETGRIVPTRFYHMFYDGGGFLCEGRCSSLSEAKRKLTRFAERQVLRLRRWLRGVRTTNKAIASAVMRIGADLQDLKRTPFAERRSDALTISDWGCVVDGDSFKKELKDLELDPVKDLRKAFEQRLRMEDFVGRYVAALERRLGITGPDSETAERKRLRREEKRSVNLEGGRP